MSENIETPQQKVTKRLLTPEELVDAKSIWAMVERKEAAERQEQKDLIKEAVLEALNGPEEIKIRIDGPKLRAVGQLGSYRHIGPTPEPTLSFFARPKQKLFGKG